MTQAISNIPGVSIVAAGAHMLKSAVAKTGVLHAEFVCNAACKTVTFLKGKALLSWVSALKADVAATKVLLLVRSYPIIAGTLFLTLNVAMTSAIAYGSFKLAQAVYNKIVANREARKEGFAI